MISEITAVQRDGESFCVRFGKRERSWRTRAEMDAFIAENLTQPAADALAIATWLATDRDAKAETAVGVKGELAPTAVRAK